MILLTIAVAPVAIILFYIYLRDKYQKEPIKVLLKSFFVGIIIILPVILIEGALDNYWETKMEAQVHKLYTAFYSGFIVAAFTEEVFKFVALYWLIWRSKFFDERFDGIVYAVFVSLGFAAIENIAYVLQSGFGTGILRAFTAVPAHALFGVTMGFYFGLAKFFPEKRAYLLSMSVLIPVVLHGIYDFILMSGETLLLLLFMPFMWFLWRKGMKYMKQMSESSQFNPERKEFFE